MITDTDFIYLERAITLAEMALEKGDEPFGSVLVSKAGDILFEDHNHVAGGDHTQHPEFAIARWAANHLTAAERKTATVYTSGEHCPMCAAAHGWVGLGRIVYAGSSAQLTTWLTDIGAKPSPVYPLPIEEVVRDIDVAGPVLSFAPRLQALHEKSYLKNK